MAHSLVEAYDAAAQMLDSLAAQREEKAKRDMRVFETGATRDTAEDKPDYRGFLSPAVLKRFGQYMLEHQKQADGKLRASDNWKKGIPIVTYVSSLLRHTVDAWYMHEEKQDFGKAFEDLLCAILFNVSGWLHEVLKERGMRECVVSTVTEPASLSKTSRINPSRSI